MPAPIKYKPVGKCIYCGRNSLQLSDEHIIAEAIGGNVILPKASCHRCSKITTKLEGHCFRGTLGAFRVQTKSPSKRTKQRPSSYKLTVQDENGSFSQLDIPIESYPAFLMLPKFNSMPKILSGEHIDPAITCDAWAHVTKPNPVIGTYKTIVSGPFNANRWLRMLAKIAHSYAIAELGLSAFKPLLPKLILGHKSATLELFGCIGDTIPPAEDIGKGITHHRIHLISAKKSDNSEVEYLVADLRLFANYGSPQYHIVVGSMK
jgi:hypothetical protein